MISDQNIGKLFTFLLYVICRLFFWYRYGKATPELFWGYGLAAFPPLNRPVFVKRKHNLLSAGADHVYPIIIVYKPVVWLFSCDLRDISIRYLPAAHPIKRWMSCHNHVTYAHSSGIRGRIYEKSALSIPYSPLMDYYFYTFANEERAYSRVRLMVFLHCLHWWIDISTLLQMGNGHVTVYALLFFHRLH